MKNASNSGLSRRRFLVLSGMAAAAAPTIITGCATATGQRRPNPSGRITMGVVGWGMQGPGNTRQFMNLPDCQVVAACDLDKKHLRGAGNAINQHYGNKDCKTYHDYREMFARTDIDAVMLAVPDHWHALLATEAARQKKDIWGEKPLARTIAEQQAIVKAVQKNHCIWQTGSWQRSVPNFQKAVEIVRNGLIGKVTRVEVGLPSGHSDVAKTGQFTTPSAPPPELDYETWIGPSKMEPYIRARVHMNWRWNYNTGGGQLLDWVGHHVDIAHWGLDFDRTGPGEIEGKGEFPPADAVWNACTRYRLELKYPQGISMVIAGGYDDIKAGTKWIGTNGWVWVNRGGFEGSNEEWRDYLVLPDSLAKIKVYRSSGVTGHFRNFIDCVKSRKPTVTPVETAHNSAIPGHLGLISMLTGRKITWNHKAQVIVGDKEASHLLTRPYRTPYQLNV